VIEQRRLGAELVARGVSERLACRTVGISRSTYRYRARGRRRADEDRLRELVTGVARRHPRYGYRRVTAVLRRRGEPINHKRIWRMWRAAGLSLPRKRPGKPRRAPAAGALPTRATHRGHVWTYDFAFDRTEDGRPLKLLALLDEYTRECHQIRVGRRLDAAAVLETLAEAFAAHGAPAHLRSDNGGEFVAGRVQAWLRQWGTRTLFIAPGHPWENGYAESFIGKLRDECLNVEVFVGVADAQVLVERWRREYNEARPHSALGYRTPAEVAGSVGAGLG
jgi:putative transposase